MIHDDGKEFSFSFNFVLCEDTVLTLIINYVRYPSGVSIKLVKTCFANIILKIGG